MLKSIQEKIQEKRKDRFVGSCPDLTPLFRELRRDYASLMEQEEINFLLYLEAQFYDLLASDIGRDSTFLEKAVDRYERVLASPYKSYDSQKRLAELKSVPPYLLLCQARQFSSMILGELAVIALCNQVLEDENTKKDMRREARELRLVALKRLNLFESSMSPP